MIKFGMFTYVVVFNQKVKIFIGNKVVLVRISRALLIKSPYEGRTHPSSSGRLFPALLAPSRTALIRGFYQ